MIDLEDDVRGIRGHLHLWKVVREHEKFIKKARKAFKNGELDCIYRSMYQKEWKV